MIYIRTIAYNAASTLSRAIESVLNQTYNEFTYYLCDNGSIDNGETKKIIKKYAKKDNRIVPFYNDKNHVFPKDSKLVSLPHDIGSDDFFCLLDSDDEYENNFFEEMIQFINRNNLDIAVCGSDFINSDNNKLVRRRFLQQDIILQNNDFQNYFTIYHQFMRTIWGKLFKGKTLRNTILDPNSPKMPRVYGNDTFFTTCAFSEANRVGILAGSLHKYYLSSNSSSYNFQSGRIKCDVILHESTRNFLSNKCGFIASQNQMFLNGVYYHAINDTLNVLFKSNLSPLQKMISLKEIFTCQYTLDLFNQSDIYVRLEADCASIVTWILAQNICRRREGANLASQILVAMYKNRLEWIDQKDLEEIILILPELVEYILKKDYKWILERLHKWFKRHDSDVPALVKLQITAYRFLKKPEDEYFTLLAEIKKSKPQSSKKLDIDNLIYKQIEKYPILKNMSVDFLCIFLGTVRWILKNDYTKAIEAFASLSELEINDDYTEQYLVFSQNLAAGAERADIYIYFKKLWISYLLERKRIEEASNELYEFEQIMPEDEDFLSLRNKIRHAKYSL